MAVHNGASHVGETIASVRAQSHDLWELLVVDDGSSDGTAPIVRDWTRRDRRVRLLERAHSGQALALNQGILAAQGRYIARVDHDDLWHPDKLKAQLAYMQQTRVDVCGAWVRRIGDAHGLIRFPIGHEAMRYEALFTCPILDSATLFLADVLRENPYPPSALVRTEMVQLLRLLPQYRFANLPRALASYRMHATQKTKRLAGLAVYRQRQLQQAHFAQLVPDANSEEREVFALVADSAPLAEEDVLRIAELFVRRLRSDDLEARQRVTLHWRRLVARRAPARSARTLRRRMDVSLLATAALSA
jgi:hypothetical protein